jgi:hypothetical protein
MYFTVMIKKDNYTDAILYDIVSDKENKKYWSLIDNQWEQLSEHPTKQAAEDYMKEEYSEYINVNKICHHCKMAEGSLASIKYYDERETTLEGLFRLRYIPKIYICEQCANECEEVKYL